ncbi:hypothetical protein CYLTODRAFT_418166 [Cylindrobasidium torrendii FP15055 ss-10]|uniref:Autophagy-related protein 2 n=1 Tax=Cylindrobasidium torrendii FP15055 ss-10 TaxID=1314674 RepID=A0A0D7BPV2_9AGAR|nr:hypothetical protein CYLTODRAFT_418166 [Cylindrobasidium torrendii FP15055 ss-10]
MSWFTSWLPIPPFPSLNIQLPSGIQSRFLSFVLKRALGHFLKPGQLDASQIDSQIGSGHVKVANLQLDSEAINPLLDGLPVVLHAGTIGLVTARIPWPNPLTSVVGFSVKSLHLTLHILPKPPPHAKPTVDLNESVISVAESFVHEELSPDQEEVLRQSFHAELAASLRDEGDVSLPGGLGASTTLGDGDLDPAGVSLVANMIEGLLARFEFDAEDTRITLVHPGKSSITVRLAELRYHTEDATTEVEGSKTRSVRLNDLSVTASNMSAASDLSSSATSTQQATSSMTASTLQTPRRSPSPTSSTSSSLDEDTHLAMSQSLAFLPPRPHSPASSAASSMYASAISTADITPEAASSSASVPRPRSPRVDPPNVPHRETNTEETILSFGKDPIVFTLVTPPPIRKQLSPPGKPQATYEETLKFSLSGGVLAFALRSWHIRCLMDILEAFSALPLPQKGKEGNKAPSSAFLKLAATVELKGIVGIVLPAIAPDADPHTFVRELDTFYEKPLVPPRLSTGYVRLLVEKIAASGSLAPSVTALGAKLALPTLASAQPLASLITASATIHEISVFVFGAAKADSLILNASPVLITDHHLNEEYSRVHEHPDPHLKSGECPPLPVFDIVDWTDPKHFLHGSRISHWRTKHRSSSTAQQDTASVASITVTQKSVRRKKTQTETTETDVDVSLVPLHILVNLRQCVTRETFAFIDELKRPSTQSQEVEEPQSDTDDSLEESVSREGDTQSAVDSERRRLEQMVLKDLKLDYDYRNQQPATASPQQAPKVRRRRSPAKSSTILTVHCPMLRAQVRTPPLPDVAARSGPLIIDVHDFVFTNHPPSKKPAARFTDYPAQADIVASIQLSRLVFAAAGPSESKALGVASLGSLTGLAGGSEESGAIVPTVSFVKTSPVKTSLRISVPSLYVNIQKATYDYIQYAIDDASQLVEVTFGGEGAGGPSKEKVDSREASIIGSRFFVQSRAGSDGNAGESATFQDESAIGVVNISEAFVRMQIPGVPVSDTDELRMTVEGKPLLYGDYPMDMYASDVDVELRPDGKDETAAVVNIMDATLKHVSPSGSMDTLLELTAPRSLTSPGQPMLNLVFKSLAIPETSSKESRIRLTLWGFTFNFRADISWVDQLASFFKAPPGAFESVVPSECTRVVVRVLDGSLAAFTPTYPGCLVVNLGDLEFGANLVGGAPEVVFRLAITSAAVLLIDDTANIVPSSSSGRGGVVYWKKRGFALLAELADLSVLFESKPADIKVTIERIGLRLHLCADTGSALAAFIGDMTAAFQPPPEVRPPKPKRTPAVVTEQPVYGLASLDDDAFRRPPDIGPAPDMIYDDLPSNLDYLDDSFSAAAGLRELRDDDFDDFDVESANAVPIPDESGVGVVANVGGETIKMLRPELGGMENYFDNLPPEPTDGSQPLADTALQIKILRGDVNVFLYDGYDWVRTRKTIEEGIKEMRKRLAKIKQLVASGQTQDSTIEEETSALLYNSVYIGLEHEIDELEPTALIAAIDEELKDDFETVSQSSWQSLKPQGPGATPRPQVKVPKVAGKRLTRSKGPNIEFRLEGLKLGVDNYVPESAVVSRILATVKEVEILDHMKSSTWSKFLTSKRSDAKGNVRESDSDMVRVELKSLHPVPDHPSVEARLRAKILPLRLHVDQNALDFLKQFFSFEDPLASPAPSKDPDDEVYFQFAEIFPIDLKLDYKPRRVDYRALKEGKTIELMNFFHFDGAEMTLRHITLAGISGWPRIFDLLNDLWTPDVKATQLVEVISGVAPIRSVVNVGSGIADLVLLPISQYKKDGRIVRGVQRGATAFVKSTAIEAIKLGARLATGTQVILEQAEGVVGGQFSGAVTAETMSSPDFVAGELDDELDEEAFSKYAEQPTDIKEGIQSAYRSLHRNMNTAAQTILAVPMEVYERSGNEGPVRSVIRAVPIAVLKPMIGASEAVSKTLLGLHNTLDPNVKMDNELKYKQR